MASVIEGSSYQGTAIPPAGETRVRDVATEAKDQVKQVAEIGRSRLMQEADAKKSELVGSLRGFADQLEKSMEGQPVAPIAGKVAGYVRSTSSYLERGSTEDLLRDAQQQFRSRPGLILAGLFAIGFAAGRIIRE